MGKHYILTISESKAFGKLEKAVEILNKSNPLTLRNEGKGLLLLLSDIQNHNGAEDEEHADGLAQGHRLSKAEHTHGRSHKGLDGSKNRSLPRLHLLQAFSV